MWLEIDNQSTDASKVLISTHDVFFLTVLLPSKQSLFVIRINRTIYFHYLCSATLTKTSNWFNRTFSPISQNHSDHEVKNWVLNVHINFFSPKPSTEYDALRSAALVNDNVN